MHIAVLGGSGFIGHHVTRWLVEAGADVSVIHRGGTSLRTGGARSLIADRDQPTALTKALAVAAPRVLIDMTAYGRVDVSRLLAALPPSVEHLVVISSGDVYWTYGAFLGQGPVVAAAGPQDETAPLRKQLHPYRARANGPDDLMYRYEKIEVERAARANAAVPVTILRLPMVYGPGDPQQRVGKYLERLRANPTELRINSSEAGWRCTRGYVEDVAWAIRLAALDDRAAGQTFNVGEADALTELDWIRAVAGALGWQGSVLADPTEPPSLEADWRIPLVADTEHIRRALDFREPVGREEGLRRTTAA